MAKRNPQRNPYRCIYSSSWDRGLVYLLRIWPDVKKEVPDCELHIFYGVELFLAAHRGNPARMRWLQQVKEIMSQLSDVYDHGRVGHKQLKKEFLKSGIWSYPTDFSEISCITAMRSQAYGAIPVVTNFAALKETVQWGEKVDCDITTSEGQQKYKEALIEWLKKPEEEKEKIRKEMMPWAQKKFLWKNVASQWSDLFKSKGKAKVNLIQGGGEINATV